MVSHFFIKLQTRRFFSAFQAFFYAFLGQFTLFFSVFAHIQVVGYPVFTQKIVHVLLVFLQNP